MQQTYKLRPWLALLRAPEFGAAAFTRLLEHVFEPSDLFDLDYDELRQLGLKESTARYLVQPDWKNVERDLRWSEELNHHIVTCRDETYPPLLREIHAAPPLLFVCGNLDILLNSQLGMVGSRNPTPAGSEIAYQFAASLANAGLGITSGLALGIDAASHQGALSSGGHTIAVLGTGVDNIYPLRHKKLAEMIVEKSGAIVSEFPLGMSAKAENFPQRNRIISGLSRGILVVEAALQSGSLITARYAMEQGREVFAIPGSLNSPLSKGCHALIRQGAKLVETVSDITEELWGFQAEKPAKKTRPSKKSLDKSHAKLVECVGFEATSIDIIIARSHFSPQDVLSVLVELELAGEIKSVPSGYVRELP